MSDKIQSSSAIAKYVWDELYVPWRDYRATHLEPIYQMCLDAFLGNEDGDEWKIEEGEKWRSKAFAMLIKTKVMAAYSIVCDAYLQGSKIPFEISPDPEIERMLAKQNMQGIPVNMDPEGMQRKIEQQLADCKADRHRMKSILSQALYGVGIEQAPIIRDYSRAKWAPVSQAVPGMNPQMGGIQPGQMVQYQQVIEQYRAPAIENVSVWDYFRDPEAENVQDGIGAIRRYIISPYELRQKEDIPHFNKAMIDKVIRRTKDGANEVDEVSSSLPPYLRDISTRRKTIVYLSSWIRLPITLLERYRKQKGINALADDFTFNDSEHQDGRETDVHVVVANGELVRLAPNTLGIVPFHEAYWEPVPDEARGRGIAENLKHPQKSKNGLIRAAEDNAKLTSNVMTIMKTGALAPGQKQEFKPGQNFIAATDVDDVRTAMMQFKLESVLGDVYQLLGYNDNQAEEDSQIPRILSGETVSSKKQTAFEVDQRSQNSGKYLGGVIRNIDEGQTEPEVEAFYRYNMHDPELAEIHGAFVVNATGFTSFNNKLMKVNNVRQVLQLVLSHESLAAEVELRPHLESIYESLDLDTDEMFKSVEAKKQAAQMQQQSMQMQMQRFMAELEDIKSQIQETMASAELKKAQSVGEVADAKKTEAEAAKTVVETQQAAIQPIMQQQHGVVQ